MRYKITSDVPEGFPNDLTNMWIDIERARDLYDELKEQRIAHTIYRGFFKREEITDEKFLEDFRIHHNLVIRNAIKEY